MKTLEDEDKIDEITERVMNHLLIERSMIDDSERNPDRIDRYMEILRNIRKGFHTTLKNPEDRITAWVFELALSDQLDPWDIDLVGFSKLYGKKVHEETGIDLVVAGRIIEMAWSVYRMKADRTYEELLDRLMDMEEEDFSYSSWEWIDDDVDLLITHEVISSNEKPLERMVVHGGRRPVTLVELLDALKEAQREAEKIKIIKEKRKKLRELQNREDRGNLSTRMYSEDLEGDISRVMSHINRYNGHPFSFKKIYGTDGIDLLTAFISILYLAKRRSVKVWQKSLPDGEIYVLNLSHKKHEEKNT